MSSSLVIIKLPQIPTAIPDQYACHTCRNHRHLQTCEYCAIQINKYHIIILIITVIIVMQLANASPASPCRINCRVIVYFGFCSIEAAKLQTGMITKPDWMSVTNTLNSLNSCLFMALCPGPPNQFILKSQLNRLLQNSQWPTQHIDYYFQSLWVCRF